MKIKLGMKIKRLLIGLLCLIVAVIVALTGYVLLKKNVKNNTEKMFVASINIKKGHRISADMITTVDVGKDSDIYCVKNKKDIEGKYALDNINKIEPFQSKDLTDKNFNIPNPNYYFVNVKIDYLPKSFIKAGDTINLININSKTFQVKSFEGLIVRDVFDRYGDSIGSIESTVKKNAYADDDIARVEVATDKVKATQILQLEKTGVYSVERK